MILPKTAFISGAIAGVIKTVIKVVNKALKVFKLRLFVFVALLGAILYFTGALDGDTTLTVFVVVALAFSLALSITSNVKRFTKKDKKENRGVQIVSQTETEETLEPKEEQITKTQIEEKYPKYFNVKQNANYLMAEYIDRYELLLKTPNGLVKVRTDYKEQL